MGWVGGWSYPLLCLPQLELKFSEVEVVVGL